MKQSNLRKILALVIVALYAAGLIVMFCGQFKIGLSLWFVSTVGGALLLYIKRTEEKRARDEAEFEKQEREYQKTHSGENR